MKLSKEQVWPMGPKQVDGIMVGNAPCSWGKLEFENTSQSEPIGYKQMLDELVEAGYTGTELGDWDYMPTNANELRQELTKRELTMLGAFVPVSLKDEDTHAPGIEEALKRARLMKQVIGSGGYDHKPILVLSDDNGKDPVRVSNAGRVTPEMGLTDEQWNTFAEGAMKIGNAVYEETGIRVALHHHCAGFCETPEEIEKFLALTDAKSVGLVFDTAHYAFGTGKEDGASYVSEGLKRFWDRIDYVHLKEYDNSIGSRSRTDNWDYFKSVQEGVFGKFGEGHVDFGAVIQWVKDKGYTGWVLVEQDVLPGMGDPKASAEHNRKYLRNFGL